MVGEYSHLCEWYECCTKMFHAESPSRLGDRLVVAVVCGGLVYPGVSPSLYGWREASAYFYPPGVVVCCAVSCGVGIPFSSSSLLFGEPALARKISPKNTPP